MYEAIAPGPVGASPQVDNMRATTGGMPLASGPPIEATGFANGAANVLPSSGMTYAPNGTVNGLSSGGPNIANTPGPAYGGGATPYQRPDYASSGFSNGYGK